VPPNRPQRGEWRNQRNDHSRQDSHEQFNDNPISHDSKSRNSEWAIIENERNLKQCCYYKNTGNEIEKCRKCLYNNSWNNSSGDLRNQRSENGPRVGASRNTSDECNRDSGDGTRGRKCRVTVINSKKFPAFPSLSYPSKGYSQNFMLDTANPILSKQEVDI